jgi:hypothetical protein
MGREGKALAKFGYKRDMKNKTKSFYIFNWLPISTKKRKSSNFLNDFTNSQRSIHFTGFKNFNCTFG